MHRTFQIHISSDRTAALADDLTKMDAVIGLAVNAGVSQKPPGDVLMIHLLNSGADEVLRCIEKHGRDSTYLITTAMNDSLIETQKSEQIQNDVDEAIWEEMETGLRHHGLITANFLWLMALGGAIAAVGLVSEPAPQAMAFVAAAVIAPGFEPPAKIALGLVLRHWASFRRGLWASLVGYAVLIGAAALTFWLLLAMGATDVGKFTGNPEVEHLSHPTGLELTMSVCGTLAGGLIVAAFRRSVIAGALMAMVVIHAAGMVGVSVICGRFDLAWEGLERFAIDIALVILSCSLVFALKQAFFHRRKSIA